MATCITCGAELNRERAEKYNYCMSPDCQRKNLRPLEMVAVGVNKSAEQYLLLDDRTRDDMASGKYHDQRRGTYGSAAPAQRTAGTAGPADAPGRAGAGVPRGGRRGPAPARREGPRREGPRREGPRREGPRREGQGGSTPQRLPWTRSQGKLALLYNEQGLRPDEIAAKIGLSRYLVTKIILSARNGGKT